MRRIPQKFDVISQLICFSPSKLRDFVEFCGLLIIYNIFTITSTFDDQICMQLCPASCFSKFYPTKVDGQNSLTKRSPSLKLGYGLAVGNQTFSSLTFSYPFVCPSHLQFQAEFLKILNKNKLCQYDRRYWSTNQNEQPILRIPNFNFPNLRCCEMFFFFHFNIKSHIGIFGYILILI